VCLGGSQCGKSGESLTVGADIYVEKMALEMGLPIIKLITNLPALFPFFSPAVSLVDFRREEYNFLIRKQVEQLDVGIQISQQSWGPSVGLSAGGASIYHFPVCAADGAESLPSPSRH
jgi:hypothetical protein